MRTPEGQTVSIAKAAKILGVGKNQMYRAVGRGQVPTIKINDRDRVSLPWLKRQLRGNAT